MKVRWFHSLSFRFFLAAASLVAAISAAISYQNGGVFRGILERQFEEAVVGEAQRVVAAVDGRLRYSRTIAQAAVAAGARLRERERKMVLDSLLAGDRQVLGLLVRGESSDVFHAQAGIERPEINLTGLEGASTHLEVLPGGRMAISHTVPTNEGKFTGTLVVTVEFLIGATSGDSETRLALDSAQGQRIWGRTQTDVSKLLLDERVDFDLTRTRGKDGQHYLRVVHRLSKEPYSIILERRISNDNSFVTNQVARLLMFGWILFLLAAALSYVLAEKLSRTIVQVTEATVRIASGEFDVTLDTRGKDEVGVLALAVKKMGEDLRGYIDLQVESTRRETELRTAREVQARFQPVREIRMGNVSIEGDFRPATECAGDWWGAFSLPDGKILVALADITGHGASAALVVSAVFSWFSMEFSCNKRHFVPRKPHEILLDLNSFLVVTGHGCSTLTCFLALVDPSSGNTEYSSAGHLPPYLFSTTAERGITKRPLNCAGSILGMDESPSFTTKQVVLSPGDRLFIFSDGLLECRSRFGRLISRRELCAFLSQELMSNPEHLAHRLSGAVSGFFAGQDLDDDITTVLMTFGESIPKSKEAG